MKIDENVLQIADALSALDSTMAVVLGGSRSLGLSDADSDWDLYVYQESEASDERRRELLQPFVSRAEIGNRFWETEDDCLMRSGVPLDIIYRGVKDTEESLIRTVVKGAPSSGYTTCIWHNILHSQILSDPSGWFGELQMHYHVPYPEELRKNIISHNRVLLSGSIASYDRQIEKAEKRNDIVSINHRVAAFLASYFDIIFAMNRMTHPGEKRLLPYCIRNCPALPDKFGDNIASLPAHHRAGLRRCQRWSASLMRRLSGPSRLWFSGEQNVQKRTHCSGPRYRGSSFGITDGRGEKAPRLRRGCGEQPDREEFHGSEAAAHQILFRAQE